MADIYPYPDPDPCLVVHSCHSDSATRNHDHACEKMTEKSGPENDRGVCYLPGDPKGSVWLAVGAEIVAQRLGEIFQNLSWTQVHYCGWADFACGLF